MTKPEIPKRLAPSREALRELYLKSGNRCAFSACKKALFNDKGVFVGQICHIEAAEPRGARFNKAMTNEERRRVSNLVLMCYDHHIETDNTKKYPVKRMQRIKSEHEKKFSDVVGTMLLTVTDHTTLTAPVLPKNLIAIEKVLNWQLNEDERKDLLKDIKSIAGKLAAIPIPSRELFAILIKRATKGQFGADLEVSVAEIQQATSLSSTELRECFSILHQHGFTFNNDTNDFGVQMAGIAMSSSEWPIWSDLRKFCSKQSLDIAHCIVNLDFSVIGGED